MSMGWITSEVRIMKWMGRRKKKWGRLSLYDIDGVEYFRPAKGPGRGQKMEHSNEGKEALHERKKCIREGGWWGGEYWAIVAMDDLNVVTASSRGNSWRDDSTSSIVIWGCPTMAFHRGSRDGRARCLWRFFVKRWSVEQYIHMIENEFDDRILKVHFEKISVWIGISHQSWAKHHCNVFSRHEVIRAILTHSKEGRPKKKMQLVRNEDDRKRQEELETGTYLSKWSIKYFRVL